MDIFSMDNTHTLNLIFQIYLCITGHSGVNDKDVVQIFHTCQWEILICLAVKRRYSGEVGLNKYEIPLQLVFY